MRDLSEEFVLEPRDLAQGFHFAARLGLARFVVKSSRFLGQAGRLEGDGGVVGKRLEHEQFVLIEKRAPPRVQLTPGDQSADRSARARAERDGDGR